MQAVSIVSGTEMVTSIDDATIIAQFKETDAWGLYTSVDLKGCNPDIIRDAERIREFVAKLCDLIDMKRFGETQVVHFGQDDRVAGYSMTQLIETSLVSGHFANETNAAYLDIFSCKEYGPYLASEFCREFFQAESAQIQVMLRL
jgi:S-adenosylmethionine/arginine decarboxylase-like enzyme